jgi:hypothetical protein
MQKRLRIFLVVLSIVAFAVVGFISWAKYRAMPAVQNQAPSLSQSVQPQSDQQPLWKTYRNEEYGFEIQYPPDFVLNYKQEILYTDAILVLSSPQTKEEIDTLLKQEKRGWFPRGDIFIYVSSLDKNISLAQYLQDHLSPGNIISYKNIPLYDNNAYEVIWGGQSQNYAIDIQNGYRRYEIYFEHRAKQSEITALEQQILASFRLLN